MKGPQYDLAHDWDLGTVTLKYDTQLDYHSLPIGHYCGDSEVLTIIRGIRKRLARRISEKGEIR